MRPVGHVFLNDAGDAGGARRVAQVVIGREVEDGVVRIGHGALQKQERIGEARVSLALERVGQCLRSDLRGNLAVVVPTHAVCNHHKEGVA